MTLSVVVPMRDVEDYAPDLLLSLARNARPDFEFLVVDDASRDATPQVLADLGARVPNLSVLRHDVSRGLSAARNTGLRAACGRYLTFVDGDDWLRPGYLADLVAAMDDLGCDFVRVDHVQVFDRKRVIQRAPQARRNVVLAPRASILPANQDTMVDYPYAWAGIYSRRLHDEGLLDFDDALLSAEDRPWIWRLHRRASSFAVVPLLGYFYRRNVAASLTQVGDERQLHFLRAFTQVLTDLTDAGEPPALVHKAVRTLLAVTVSQVRRAERLEPGLAARLRTEARLLLASVPPDALAEALNGMDPARAQVIRRLMAARRLLAV